MVVQDQLRGIDDVFFTNIRHSYYRHTANSQGTNPIMMHPLWNCSPITKLAAEQALPLTRTLSRGITGLSMDEKTLVDLKTRPNLII